MKKYWLINVSGSNGYSMMVYCEAKDEFEAINMASDANLFDDEEDAEYAFAEEADDDSIEHFKKYGMIQTID